MAQGRYRAAHRWPFHHHPSELAGNAQGLDVRVGGLKAAVALVWVIAAGMNQVSQVGFAEPVEQFSSGFPLLLVHTHIHRIAAAKAEVALGHVQPGAGT